jgi:hypothetical protein
VGVDTVRHEYVLHSVLHAWMSFGGYGSKLLDLERFNDQVYADLFLTPASDPWLGLAAPETFMALDPAPAAPAAGSAAKAGSEGTAAADSPVAATAATAGAAPSPSGR